MRRITGIAVLLTAAALGALAPPAFGAGFALFEHGARPVAMAGAFCAIADDPTAIYYNPAGISFLDGTQAAFGAYFIKLSSDFTGANPYPGADYKASQKSQIFYPPHGYATGRLTDRLNWGVGFNAPFGLGTWWENDFAGKYITKRADLKIFNFNPTLSYKLTPNFAVAFGADYFMAGIDLTKSVGVINPYTQKVAEVGQVHLDSKQQTGLGWNAAFLAKSPSGWSLGASYRSKVKVDFKGTAYFTQYKTGYPDFDAIVAAQIPFSNPPEAKSSIEFPSEMRAGIGYQGQRWVVDFDYVRMGWSSFKELPITLVGYPQLSSVRPENYKDSSTYRLGFQYKSSPTWSWMFGGLYDKTPVPTESVSPLLPDADRTGVSVGFSWGFSKSAKLEFGYLHLMFKERATDGKDGDNFNGRYKNSAELVGFTYVYRF